ncbi:hypothetical protein HY410_00655 [Candidatus Gottesmanbacteria bacterium]|nr:hypothetical protein [Candidatus Gottesmanbacteria bacterium]
MKKLLLIVSILLVIVAIPVTVYLVSQQQELRKRAAPATTLSLTPASTTKTVGSEFSMEVQIDTGDNQVIASELHITYDPVYLEAMTITNGALFPNVLVSGRIEQDTASITVGAPSNVQPVTGQGIVAVIRFKTLAPTESTSLRFAETTLVSGLGEGSTNVLTTTRPATIIITGSEEEPVTSATQSASLNQNASPSGEATPSASLEILTPTASSTAQLDRPTIKGTAAPGSKVTLTIYSEPITVVVTADANGNWVYTPQTPLAPGPHTIVVTAGDGSDTTTQSFVVATGSGDASGSGVPVSGNYELTILIMSLAFSLIGIGIAIPFVIRH